MKKSLVLSLVILCILVSVPNEVQAKFKPNITVEQMREVNAYGDAIETAIAKRQYFSKQGRLQSTDTFWLTKVNPTYECKFVQKYARIVQKMSKKVQEKSLLDQFEIQILNQLPTATIQCC